MSGIYWKDKIENNKTRYIWINKKGVWCCTNYKPKPIQIKNGYGIYQIKCCICDLCECINKTMLEKEFE